MGEFITVIDLHNTSLGEIATLKFPENVYPKIGMILNRSDNASWRIKGWSRPKHSGLLPAYKHLAPTWLHGCTVTPITPDKKLAVGDSLFI